MAGDWIKMRASLCTHPKVLMIAEIIGESVDVGRRLSTGFNGSLNEIVTCDVTRDVTLAALLRVWCATNEHTDDGIWKNSTLRTIDQAAGIPGFGEAMQEAGWAIYNEDARTVELPNFLENNAPAKDNARSTAAERQARYREKLRAARAASPESSADGDVTRDVTLSVTSNAREEKRREEKKEEPKNKTPRAPRFDAQAHLVSMGVDNKVAEDWLSLRKKKNLAPTATSFEGVLLEAGKAGMTMDQALRTCCTRGWGGFDAAWLDKGGARSGGGGVVPLNRQEALERQNRKIAMEFAQELRHAAI